jgi:hypothetical protein
MKIYQQNRIEAITCSTQHDMESDIWIQQEIKVQATGKKLSNIICET